MHLPLTYKMRAVGLLACKLTPEQVSLVPSDSYSSQGFFRSGYQLWVFLALNVRQETKQEITKNTAQIQQNQGVTLYLLNKVKCQKVDM